MNKRSLRLVFLLVSAWSVQTLQCQTQTAQITGTITDPSSAPVNGALVRVTNLDTGAMREAMSSGSGHYAIPLLDPGRYEASVQVARFKPFTKTHIILQVDQVARIDFELELGPASDNLTVEATPTLLDAATSSLSEVVENRQITELPTNGRNTLGFVGLTPGIRMQTNAATNPNITNIGARGNFSANGGLANANEVLIDGAPVTLGRGNSVGILPSADATREFRVETGNFAAEFGRSAGAVVNISIKSGSNRWHGALYEFLRNRDFDANNFFQNKAGLPRARLSYNQYGASTGAPIRRDKTFFFGNIEGFSQRQGVALTATVPTLLQRSGNFSQTFNAAGQLILIADPLTTKPAGQGYLRTVLPGNVIPDSRLDPVAARFTQFFWPLPNQSGSAFTNVNNFATSSNQPIDAYQGVGKLDHTVNATWKLFVSYAQQRIDRGAVDPFHNNATPVIVGYVEDVTTHYTALGATAVLASRWLAELRSSFIRFEQHRLPPNVPFDVTKLGLPQSLLDAEEFRTVPVINVSGLQGVSVAASSTILGASNNWSQSASLTYMHASQSLKFGGTYRRMQANDVSVNYGSPNLVFNGQFTSVDPLAVSATSGVGMGSFLLGYPNSGSMNYAFPLANQRSYTAAFVQDDWTLSRRLTLNLGLQYSLDGSITERFNRTVWFDPIVVPPIGQQAGIPAPGALQFATGNTRTPENLYRKQWAPRVGLALQAFRNTVVRTAYGIVWLPNNLQTPNTGVRATPWSSTTTFVGSLDGGITPYNTLSNPFPSGIVFPPGSIQGPDSLLGQDLMVYLRSNHTGYVQQWNFDVQRDFWADSVVDISYVGSKGTGLPLDIQLNQLPPQYMGMGTSLIQQVPNPFYGHISNGILASPTIAREQLLRPYPQFGNVLATGANAGSATFHSMQLKVNRRFGSSLVAAAYTVSKCIGDSESTTPLQEASGQPGGGTGQLSNNYNHRQDRSLAEFDAPQRFVLNYTLNLPLGKGQRYGRNPSSVGRLVSGWQISGIYTAQSGTPIFLSTSTNLTNAFLGFSRPDIVSRSARLSGAAQSRVDDWFDTTAFRQPQPYAFGTTSRTLPDVRDHGINNLDMGFFKNNPIGRSERLDLQFRAEFFNLANRVRFADPGLVFGTPQFSVVSAQANAPRQIQFALKLIY